MTALSHVPATDPDRRGIAVLAAGQGSSKIGYALGGLRPGPNTLVAGFDPISEPVFQRLLVLPTLTWLRGTLYLVRLEPLGDSRNGAVIDRLCETPFDRILILPFASSDGSQEDLVNEAYMRVLRLCRELGMIDGRGVQ